MSAPTRGLAHALAVHASNAERMDTLAAIHDMDAAAGAINALLDAIEAGGMVQPRPAPVMDLGPLRELRVWHHGQAEAYVDAGEGGLYQFHRRFIDHLNQYFPEGDRL